MTRYAMIGCLALALVGCGGQDDGNTATDPTPMPSAVAAPRPVASPVASAVDAKPVTIAEDSRQLDFKYVMPTEAAAIPALRTMLVTAAQRERAKALADQREDVASLPADVEPRPFAVSKEWKPVAETHQLLVLVADGYYYWGGAHGSDVFDSVIWDRAQGRRIRLADLFTDAPAALATIRRSVCGGLDKARLKRRGPVTGDGYDTRCPRFDEMTIAPYRTVGGKFSRIGVWIAADVAGAHAEGNYVFDVAIPKAMIPLVAPRWRASFPTG